MRFNFDKADPTELYEFIHAMDAQELRDFLHRIERTIELDAVRREAVKHEPWRLDKRVANAHKQIMKAMLWCEGYVDQQVHEEDRWFTRDLVRKVSGEVLESGCTWTVDRALSHIETIRDLTFDQLKARRQASDLGYTVYASRDFVALVNLGYLATKPGKNGGYRMADALARNPANMDNSDDDG